MTAASTEPVLFGPEFALDCWLWALEEEYGLYINVPDPKDINSFKTKMYQARSDFNDIRLSGLTLYVPQDGSYILIKNEMKSDLP